ncbi:MAG: selenide, water dikinase SelD [Flavobacteriia bacterium]|nr:MAG: selenide, water dikinase SelD [Flavobacteriia bacterium]
MNRKEIDQIKLTKYSHGAGCGCKISPEVLSTIIKTEMIAVEDARLIVGNDSKDDAAVYDLGDGTAVISTTDFFMPIVDDPYNFGRIAATNAISDVYAMGGKPILAIAILGWPIDKLPAEVAQQVLEGGRQVCKEAGITLAGGHSIDSPEPIFGLAVTGRVDLKKLKRNDSAVAGCHLYLTKPLGIGTFTTAQKRGLLTPEHEKVAVDSMAKLNSLGEKLAEIKGVTAMTDVTGFGLIGHLIEICEGSGLSAEIEWDNVPVFDGAEGYLEQNCIPGGTRNNWKSFKDKVQLKDESKWSILCDPQTSGGLLIAVEDAGVEEVEALLKENQIEISALGKLTEPSDVLIRVV